MSCGETDRFSRVCQGRVGCRRGAYKSGLEVAAVAQTKACQPRPRQYWLVF